MNILKLLYKLLEPFWKTKIFMHLIIDIIIDIIHPLPYFDKTLSLQINEIPTKKNLQTYIYMSTFAKTYIVLRTLAAHTVYRGLEAQLIR